MTSYGVVVADPPWRYRNFTVHGAAAAHYGTLDGADLAAIPVAGWVAEDAVLAMWATWPKLDEAVELVRAWGFEYVTGLPWVKTTPSVGDVRRGVGFWFMATSELVLVGRRGAPRRRGGRECAPLGLLAGAGR